MSGMSCVVVFISYRVAIFVADAWPNPAAHASWLGAGRRRVQRYIFATDDGSTVVLSIKGTSAQWVDTGPTTEKHKMNDNLLFSCCCTSTGRGRQYATATEVAGNVIRTVSRLSLSMSLFYPVGTVSLTVFPNLSHWPAVALMVPVSWLSEPLQQYHVDVSPRKHLGHRPFPWRRPCHHLSESRLAYQS